MTPIIFGIPLKSRSASKDWLRVSQLFEDTLRSIFNQINPSFRIVVACHEIPEVSFINDPRLELIQVSFPPPVFLIEKKTDQFRKREVIAARARQLGGGYLMFVDADDLISNRLVDFVHHDRSPFGYTVEDGWELDYERQITRWAPRFNRLSSTCAIIKWNKEDLPFTPLDQNSSPFRLFYENNHPTWAAVSAAMGRPLKRVPFRAVTYVWNNGENLSVERKNVGKRREFLRRILPGRKPKPEIVREFSLYGRQRN